MLRQASKRIAEAERQRVAGAQTAAQRWGDWWLLSVFGSALLVYLLASAHLIGSLNVTGDEPWYLLQGYSLTHFATVDVSRALHDPHIYRQYLAAPSTDHVRDFRGNGVLVVTYLPGYAALVGPLDALGGRLLIGGVQALAAALVTMLLASEVYRLWGSRVVALFAALVYVTCLPALLYVSQVFPSTLATLVAFTAYILIARVLPTAHGRTLLLAAGALGALAAFVPWLHIKYAPLALVIAGAGAVYVVTRLRSRAPAPPAPAAERRDLRLALALICGLTLLSFALIAAYCHHYFGTWYPQYRAQTTGTFTAPDPAHIFSLYRQMFLDRDSGLLPWAPLLALAPLGWVYLLRRRPRDAWLTGLAVVGLWSAFLSAAIAPHVNQAYALPARFTVESLPFLALWVASLCAPGWSALRSIWAARLSAPAQFARRWRELPSAQRLALALAAACCALLVVGLWFSVVAQLAPWRLYPSAESARLVTRYPHLLPGWWFDLFSAQP